MELPEIIPVPHAPDVQKTLTPAAVTPAEPPIFDPNGEDKEGKKRRRKRKARRSSHADAENTNEDEETNRDGSVRGTRIDIRA